jgi:hypothetical protein
LLSPILLFKKLFCDRHHLISTDDYILRIGPWTKKKALLNWSEENSISVVGRLIQVARGQPMTN